MTKKHFIALADAIRRHNEKSGTHSYSAWDRPAFNDGHLESLADFLQTQNPHFNRDRWIGYIKGHNGPNGGAV